MVFTLKESSVLTSFLIGYFGDSHATEKYLYIMYASFSINLHLYYGNIFSVINHVISKTVCKRKCNINN